MVGKSYANTITTEGVSIMNKSFVSDLFNYEPFSSRGSKPGINFPDSLSGFRRHIDMGKHHYPPGRGRGRGKGKGK